MLDLLQPKPIEVETQDGGKRTYTISKFPAVQGREIIAKYPLSSVPKLGDYAVNEETMLKLMSFVGVETEAGSALKLSTKSLINNHVPDWETLTRIEWAMLEYNTSFFANGKLSIFLKGLAQNLPSLISKILTGLSVPSSMPTKPPSTNSEPSTP